MRRTNTSRFLYLWSFLLICSLAFVVPQISLVAEQEDDVILKALKDELTRSVDQLQLEDMEKPYYIEYSVQESERFALSPAAVPTTYENSALTFSLTARRSLAR